MYLRLSGIHGRAGVSRVMRPLFRDRGAARASIERVLALDFERVVVAHGKLVNERGPEVVRESYRWL